MRVENRHGFVRKCRKFFRADGNRLTIESCDFQLSRWYRLPEVMVHILRRRSSDAREEHGDGKHQRQQSRPLAFHAYIVASVDFNRIESANIFDPSGTKSATRKDMKPQRQLL